MSAADYYRMRQCRLLEVSGSARSQSKWQTLPTVVNTTCVRQIAQKRPSYTAKWVGMQRLALIYFS